MNITKRVNPRWESMAGIVNAVNEFSQKCCLGLWTMTGGSSSDWVIQKI